MRLGLSIIGMIKIRKLEVVNLKKRKVFLLLNQICSTFNHEGMK